jgi:histidine kinase
VRIRRDVSLFWRLIVSYLLVILVGSFTVLVAGEAFAPIFLERHVRAMPMMVNVNVQPMLSDLDAAFRRAFTQSLMWGSLVAMVLAAAVALLVTSQVTRPLRRMQRASGRIAAGHYRERLDAQAPGEIGDLAEAFNAMAAALETSEAQQVELIGNVAHELRTPLSSLQGYVEGIEDGLFEVDEETLEAFKRQVIRLKRLVDDLSLLSRVEAGEEQIHLEPVNLIGFLQQTIVACRPPFLNKGVALTLDPGATPLTVLADPERTAQVLINLLSNALRHTSTGGEVHVTAEPGADGEVILGVQDTGEGIPDEALPHVFTRFYRADSSRRQDGESGSGIGLTIAKQYVEVQGGASVWKAPPDRAACSGLRCPRCDQGSARALGALDPGGTFAPGLLLPAPLDFRNDQGTGLQREIDPDRKEKPRCQELLPLDRGFC